MIDYEAFFADVVAWIKKANQAAMQYGMESYEFWQSVADSAGEISNRYRNHPLVVKQMMMLVEWLTDATNAKQNKQAR